MAARAVDFLENMISLGLAPGGRLVIADYGRPTGLIGQIAAFPMHFDFHEYVRGQLAGELEGIIG